MTDKLSSLEFPKLRRYDEEWSGVIEAEDGCMVAYDDVMDMLKMLAETLDDYDVRAELEEDDTDPSWIIRECIAANKL